MFDEGNGEMGSDTTSRDERMRTGVALGATYEGRDPQLLDRMLPHVEYIEVTLETISEVIGDRIALSDEIMAELKDLRGAAKIVVHGVSLSIGSHDGWSPTYLDLLDQFLEQIDV